MPGTLADVWLVIIGFLLVLAVVLDGCDLGVGLLALGAGGERRAVMMQSVGKVWVVNQTWLVVLGGMLFGAFPRFYGVVLTSLYLPLLLMLAGLIFRAVAFEFRGLARRPGPWGLAFAGGSLAATAGQGLALGGLLGGLPVSNGRFVGGGWEWLSPLALLVAAGVAGGYALLGAAYLLFKAGGEVQQRSYRHARIASWLTVATAVGVNLWLGGAYPHVALKWSQVPARMAVFPIVAACAFVGLQASLSSRRREAEPFVWSAVLVLSLFAGASFALYPYMIPPFDTVDMAAASPKTLRFMLVATGVLLPLMLGYNIYQFRVFRGKAGGPGDGYAP